jgi:hypothetical protein
MFLTKGNLPQTGKVISVIFSYVFLRLWNLCKEIKFPAVHQFQVFFAGINITSFRQQGPSWSADSRSASQSIFHLLWNPKIHYRVHKSKPLDPVMSQKNPAHILKPYSFKIHFNIISVCFLVSEIDYFHQVFRPKFCLHFLSHMHVTCPTHLVSLYLSTVIRYKTKSFLV